MNSNKELKLTKLYDFWRKYDSKKTSKASKNNVAPNRYGMYGKRPIGEVKTLISEKMRHNYKQISSLKSVFY